MKCDRCGSTDQVRKVYPRAGWGNAGQSYYAAQNWCATCCRRKNGQYMLAYGQPKLKPRKAKK